MVHFALQEHSGGELCLTKSVGLQVSMFNTGWPTEFPSSPAYRSPHLGCTAANGLYSFRLMVSTVDTANFTLPVCFDRKCGRELCCAVLPAGPLCGPPPHIATI